MIRKSITIGISNGLEARPIAMLVQVASQYTSNILPGKRSKKGECQEHHGNDESWIG